MKCSEIRERLSAYIDAELDERTLEEIEVHLSGCEQCRDELAALRMLVSCAGDIEEVESPVDLKQRIFEAVEETPAMAHACSEIRELLSAYVDGELIGEQAASVSAHVNECKECAKELHALQTIAGSARSLESVNPPANIRSRIAAATRESRSSVGFLEWLRGAISVRPARWAAGAAAAGVLAAAVLIGLPEAPNQPTKPAADRDAARMATQAIPSVESAPAVTAGETPAETVVVRPSRTYANRTRSVSVESGADTVVVMPAVDKTDSADNAEVAVAVENVSEPIESGAESPDVVEVVKEQPKMAVLPEPAPEISIETQDQPTAPLIKVASAPVWESEETEKWLEKVKAQAVMRTNGARPRGITIVSSNF